MNSLQIQKRRERNFIIFCSVIFFAILVIGSLGDRKEKYKVNPDQIIKNINDAREGKLNE